MKKKSQPIILVTGSKGQVGQELHALAPQYPDFQFLFVDVDELDITNPTAVNVFFEKRQLDYCLNCAAYTAVDKAETETALAWKVNTVGPDNLAKACAKTGANLFHLSTDYVYHTDKNKPYIETDQTNPQGVYARTKKDGDDLVLRSHPTGSMVIRTSWVYSAFGNNFVKTMLKLGADRAELSVVYDQIGTPTYARDLAKALLDIVYKAEKQELDKSLLRGVYHYSNEGVTSWYDFAVSIFEIQGMAVKVHPIETKEYPTPAQRPPFSILNKNKIKNTFKLEIPHWREGLVDCLRILANS